MRLSCFSQSAAIDSSPARPPSSERKKRRKCGCKSRVIKFIFSIRIQEKFSRKDAKTHSKTLPFAGFFTPLSLRLLKPAIFLDTWPITEVQYGPSSHLPQGSEKLTR